MNSDKRLINAILSIEEREPNESLLMFEKLDNQTKVKVLWYVRSLMQLTRPDYNSGLFDELLSK